MPEQVPSAIVYGVIPPRFGSPPLRAVTARLAYLAELGIDAVWLSPIAACPPGDFGYAVVDELAVRDDYGDEDDLRALVARAHAEGIRVLLDLVPNHTSHLHPFFTDGLHADWYDRDAQGQPTHYFDWTHLPNLNYDNPDVRAYMDRVFTHWVTEFDVDGFRVDACWGVQLRRPDYWPAWSRMLRGLKPGLLLIAEASARDEYWYESGYDLAYDWTDDLGRWAWEDVFSDRGEIADRLDRALAADPRPERVFRFLDNNDTGARFVTRHGPALTRVAATLLLTLPGLPCVYTGSETGAEYEPYRDPGPISFEDHAALHDEYRRLIRLRRELPALHSRRWLPFPPAEDDDVYAYARTADDPKADPVLVLLNFGASTADVELTLPEPLHALGGPTLRATLDPLSTRILTSD
jgi:cyclomaltodextrinase / maltogenic alpha-amylase / neopullulanase